MFAVIAKVTPLTARRMSTVSIAACVPLGVVHATLPGLAPVALAVAAVAVALATIVSVVSHHPDGRMWIPLTVLVGLTVAAQILAGDEYGRDAHLVAEILFVVAQIILAGGVLYVAGRRISREPLSILADGLVVALGTWLVAWIVVIRPMLESGSEYGALYAVKGVGVALGAIVVFAIVVLVYGDSARSAAMWCAVAAIGLSLTGDVLWSVREANLAELPDHVASAPYVSALLAAAAAFLHPSIRQLTSPGSARATSPLVSRLVVTTAGLVVPVVVFAVTDAQDGTDRTIRVVSILVLALAVMVRVVHAVVRTGELQEQLRRGAQTDALTGLANRTLMLQHIDASLRTAWRDGRQPAVMFIDVDRFKNINDSLGHSAGDDVLIAVADRLKVALPERCIVGRISGDEFVVLDPHSASVGDAVLLADRILESFREPLALRQGDVFASASIGVATYTPSVSHSADELLRHADTAMYRAKDSGRNCVAVFDESMLERVTQRLAVETALYRALERRELRLVHQPIIDVGLGEVVGFEALMRWDREDGGTVSPAEFIPIAEETGIIVPIGAWALLEALSHLRDWIQAGVVPRDATMAVNVSPRQLHDPNFVNLVSEALMRSHIPARQLWLEVTEGVMIAQPEQALQALRRLHDLGVRIAIDDFGTGYSSLSLLRKYPIDRLKIDRSFVSGVADDASARSLVRTIVAMCESLGLDAVAEGVETERQLRTLADLRCGKAQGYLISHPVEPDAMGSIVAALNDIGSWPRVRNPHL